jgi:hypothetical protein
VLDLFCKMSLCIHICPTCGFKWGHSKKRPCTQPEVAECGVDECAEKGLVRP